MNSRILPTRLRTESNQNLTLLQRKFRKLKRNPQQFFRDSKPLISARYSLYTARAKLGSFALVLIASVLVVIYYSLIASPRYASQTQFVIKQSNENSIALSGLAAIASSSPSTRDALIVQDYIKSIEMADALNERLKLKAHYEDRRWDIISRLSNNSSQEDFLKYYQSRITVQYNELSELLNVEVQAFEPEYALEIANELLIISEQFINQLGLKMASSQLQYAEEEVARSHDLLKEQQIQLVDFQNQHQLLNPESQSGALVNAVNNLEAEIVTSQAELKSLKSYMREDTAQVQALEYRIRALQEQLAEEKTKIASSDTISINKISADFKAIELNTQLSADLYASALASLELARADAFKKLKYLLVVERPRVAQEESYPRRLYSITTWFVILILIYLLGRLLISVVKEHRE